MQYLAMPSEDIRRNLATEQIMNSDKMKPPFMLFYIEKPCIIVDAIKHDGRNQRRVLS